MEPLPESVEAADELDPAADDDLLLRLRHSADQTREIVPDLVGVSVARISDDLTFTLVATKLEIAVLDAVQHLAGGPCVDAAHAGAVREFDAADVLDEERWQLFSQAAPGRVREHRAIGVASGILAAQLGVGEDEAEERLRDAAARAGIGAVHLARAIIALRNEDSER